MYILGAGLCEKIYGTEERERIAQHVDLLCEAITPKQGDAHKSELTQTEIILSGWGGPKLDEAFLSAAPNLRAFFYGAGSIKGYVTDAAWDRGIVVTSAWAANAIPVAEFTLAQVVCCLKRVWQSAMRLRQIRRWEKPANVIGAYGATVGIVSLGMVGGMVAKRLRDLEVKVLAYDPFATPEAARELGVELCALDDLFRRSDVITIHTPWLRETEKLIAGRLIRSMKPGASLINTSRGAVIDEPAMIEVLRERPDLFAVLDVTYPEPPASGSALYELPNVLLTPHIAGAMGDECRRMGKYVADDLDRYVRGEPLRWQVTRERAKIMA